MLEVVFEDSAAGSMSVATGRRNRGGGAFGAIVLCQRDGRQQDGQAPSQAELQRLRQEAEERERQSWAEAVPFEGRREDIVPLSLLLSVGPIDEDGVGPARRSVLEELYPDLEEQSHLEKSLEKSQRGLAVILERAGRGKPFRVWSSSNPDDACGLCWLLEQLRPVGFERLDVTLVRLPEFQARPDGAVVRYAGWGEVEPHQFGRMALAGEKLPTNVIRMMADRWRELRKENAPLRAVLNGRLVSAPETLYDSYILREIDAQEPEFHEAVLIGNVIGKCRLGIGDGWIAHRVEQFIRGGLLEPVTEAKPDGPSYRRILRKRA